MNDRPGTETELGETQLRRTAEVNQILLDNMPPAAMLLRPGTRKIVACNRAGEKVGAAPGKTCYQTWGQRDTPCPWCLAPVVWETGQAQHLQPEALGRIWDAHWIPVSDDLYLHYASDVTERKQAELALRESERRRAEAERLAVAGRLAAQVAHEINNPLSGIKNCLTLVRDAVSPDHPDAEFVDLMEREIDRITRIVRGMYELHRPDQHQVRQVSVDALIDEVVTMLQPRCRESGVRIEKQTTLPDMVRIAEGALRQILYNLVANAIDVSPPSPAGIIKIAAELADRSVKVTVSDQGTGIPDEMRGLVFEPFFTTKSGRTEGGLGLGLSISKEIAESLGGELSFDSSPGKGTVFRVVLPTETS